MDHTIVIPTYNRPELLERLVLYYYKRAWPMPLLILDSSRDELAQKNEEQLHFYGDALTYIRFPGDIPMASKLSRGLEQVDTTTVSFCADDDLVFPKGIEKAKSFLETNEDYVTAHGLYLNFTEGETDIEITREYGGLDNDANTAGARVFRLLQGYESLFYGVYRTPQLRKLFGAVKDQGSLHFQELFQSVGALLMGKTHRFPTVYAARQSCPPAEPERDRWQTYYWFADNPVEFLNDYAIYRQELLDFYHCLDHEHAIEDDDFCKMLDLAHAVYFSRGCPPEYFYSTIGAAVGDDKFRYPARRDLFDVLRRSVESRQEFVIRRLSRLIAFFRLRQQKNRKRRMLYRLDSLNEEIDQISRQKETDQAAEFNVSLPRCRRLFQFLRGIGLLY